jgi:diadenosine tetraphosphate (Ap4A) HIT family hydrolase
MRNRIPLSARGRYYADKGKMAMDSFQLHARLAADTTDVADWALSRVMLMNDARYPWLILVPRRVGLVEIHELKHAERIVLIEEINRASLGLKTLTNAVKINVGALGNLVPQLHIHVVARKPGDAAWPGPVWGHGEAFVYEQDVKTALLEKLREKL